MDDLGSMICAMQYSSSSAQQNYVGGLGSTPLDQVEAILHANQWQFTRLSADELCMDLQGEHSDYAVFFLWDEALDSLQICVQMDVDVRAVPKAQLFESVMKVNDKLWLGHFDVPAQSFKPSLRYTALLKGDEDHNIAQIEDALNALLLQSEQYSVVFKADVSSGAQPVSYADQSDVKLALMDVQGRC